MSNVSNMPSCKEILTVAAAFALALGYCYLLFWFDDNDIYHQHFFDRGGLIIHYQLARLAFIFYIAWLIYVMGIGVFRCLGHTSHATLLPWERYPLAFLAGAGVWYALLFPIGLYGFDVKPMAVMLTVVVMVFSIPHLANCLRESLAIWDHVRVLDRNTLLLRAVLAAGFAGVGGLFLLIKGLYPAGGHDYYNHYFQFYRRVIETGSILPNDVWYHFYYSKGAGLYFLGMLLTDALAPQLVATGFIACGACIVYALLKRAAPAKTLLPWAGALLYVFFQIYTPGPIENMRQGGWGDLEKHHEITAVLLLGVVWIASRLVAGVAPARAWIVALCAAILSIALLTLSLVVLVGAYLGLLTLWLIWKRQWVAAKWIIPAGVSVVTSLIVILAVNYHYTGLYTDQSITSFWRVADIGKLVKWGALFEAIDLHWARTGYLANAVPWSWNIIPLLALYLRLEIWWPLLAVPLLVSVRNRNTRQAFGRYITTGAMPVVLLFLLAVIISSVAGGGRQQPISFYRISTFSYGPTLCAVLLLWPLVPTEWFTRKRQWLALILVPVIALSVLTVAKKPRFVGENVANLAQRVQSSVSNVVINASHLARGRFSLKDAYQNQQGWPGRMPWGGIYPGIEQPWKIAGPRTRIWSFHVHSYCMLPDCNVQSVMSFTLSPQWQKIYFGSPAQGAAALRADGLNYFFFSKELQMFSELQASPLFTPEHIGAYLGIKWTDGTSYLLTWKGPGVKPLDGAFMAAYKDSIAKANVLPGFKAYLKDWKSVSDYLDAKGKDVKPFFLPWCTTCDGMPPMK